MVITIQLNVLEFFTRVRMFDFFAYFVRQLREICIDSLPLASMLGFIVAAQTLLFWTLDQNSNEPAYFGWDGLGRCAVDSYRLAIGDFEIAGSFVNNTEYIFVFWVIFFIGTLISLLVILNMVIAVMSATFERVEAETEAHVMRQKLSAILENFHRLPKKVIENMIAHRYLLVVQVDPDVDPIEKESMEKRIVDRVKTLETQVNQVNENLIQVQDHLFADDRIKNLETQLEKVSKNLSLIQEHLMPN